MSTRTVTIHHVHAALQGARRTGLDVAPLLLKAGIAPLLLADDRARVTPEQFARLIQVLWDATDDEFIGLGAAPSRRGTFAMMGRVVISCRDLGGSVAQMSAFYRLFPHAPVFQLELHGGTARLRVEMDRAEDPDHFLAESLLVIWHRSSSWLIGRRIPLVLAEFAYPPPAHREEYDPLFGCPLRFAAPATAVSFDAQLLTAPIVQTKATLRAFLHDSPAGLLARIEYGTAVSEQVRRLLAHHLRDARTGYAGLPGLTETAAALSISPATLRRRLQDEALSFQQIKDEVRRDAAITSLAESAEPISALAARLGFSENTAFHRAFKRWTGATPGAYRSAHESGLR